MLCPKKCTTYKEEGKVKVCKRCPGEHELHGVVDEFQLKKGNFKVSIVIHTRHEIEIEQIDIYIPGGKSCGKNSGRMSRS